MVRKILGIFIFSILIFLGWNLWRMYQKVGWTLDAQGAGTVSNILQLGLFLLLSGILMAIAGYWIAKLYGADRKRWARISFFSGEVSLWTLLLAGKARNNPEEMKQFSKEMEGAGKLIYWVQLLLLAVAIILCLLFYSL